MMTGRYLKFHPVVGADWQRQHILEVQNRAAGGDQVNKG